jgi:RNA polymerase-associated protein CTR9
VNEKIDPRLLNDMGALQRMEGNLAEARALYEDALTKAASLGPDVGEGMSTLMLYNLARVYEDGGDVAMVKEAYDKLLARRPEYVDSECR